MLVLQCVSLNQRGGGESHLSARFTYSMLPPEMTFALADHGRRTTWTLSNSHFNTQSRASLASLRQSENWVSNVGITASGVFRVVEPTTVRAGMPMALELNVEISWGPQFVNITGMIDRNHLLFSVRPPEGVRNGWVASYRPLPEAVFLRSDGTRMDEPQRRPSPPVEEQSPPVSEPTASSSNVETTQSPLVEEVASASTEVPLSVLQSQLPSVERVIDSQITEVGASESQEYPAIHIVDESSGLFPFSPVLVGEIPFSRPPSGETNQIVNAQIDQRPITVDQVTVGGLDDFEERILHVRQMNHARLPNDYGTQSGPRDFRIEARRTRMELRPQITISLEEVRTIIPPPLPVEPKPRPPPPPATLLRPPPRLYSSNAERDRMRTLRRLGTDFHPPLRLVSELTAAQMGEARHTRTGRINPPLPYLTDPREAWPADSPLRSLRTTPEGIRLEITPASMVFRSIPEETRSSESSSPPTPVPVRGNPEDDPEA